MPLSLPLPFPRPHWIFDELELLALELEQHNNLIETGVASVGEAAAYALVWEWGNLRQTKPGPKTVIGTNPSGKMVWLSAQAPFGYVAINTPIFWAIINEELAKVKFLDHTAGGITESLEKAAREIGKKCAVVIKGSSPIDSGELSDSITAVDPEDVFLEMADTGPALLLYE